MDNFDLFIIHINFQQCHYLANMEKSGFEERREYQNKANQHIQQNQYTIHCSFNTILFGYYLQSIYYFINISFNHMESTVPKCTYGNNCLIICKDIKCSAVPFMCNNDDCQCYLSHHNCSMTIKWKKFKEVFQSKIKSVSSTYNEYFERISDLYRSVIKRIEVSFEQMKHNVDGLGLSQIEQEVYLKIKQKKYSEISGSLINKFEARSLSQQKQIQIQSIQNEKSQVYKLTKNLIMILESLAKLKKVNVLQKVLNTETIKVSQKALQKNVELKIKIKRPELPSFSLCSKITNDMETISSMFPNKKIKSMNLLYRASENNFQVSKFWEKCDGRTNTFTIIKTEFNKIIGGYTALSWKKYLALEGQFEKDATNESFLFSLTLKHKLSLLKSKEAIHHWKRYGPAFGSGCDLVINT